MGMPITVEIVDASIVEEDIDKVFAYFSSVDDTFSTYKATSEISRINRGELSATDYSEEMKTILALGEQTKIDTHGYFDIQQNDRCDPSGIVKGWAIQNAANMLKAQGFSNFYIDAGGDIQASGYKDGALWRVGIRNPFNHSEHVKVLALTDRGIATSGTAIRGQHIYDPYNRNTPLQDIVSITVAMGKKGIQFIEKLAGFEGYMIDAQARATFTSGFERYVLQL